MNEQPDARQLRRAAEMILASRPAPGGMDSMEKLLHELHVHQIELEMQNENLRQTQFELERSRDRYMDFYDLAPVGYLTLSESGQIVEVNLTGAAMLGIERSRLLYQRLTPYVAVEFQDRWQRHFLNTMACRETQTCELTFQCTDDRRFAARLDCLRQDKSDAIVEMRIVMTDITERIKSDEKIRRLAFYDALTQLPNRRLLSDRLDHAMAASKRSGKYGSLMFIDLDNFKPLNDKFGHKVGDLLLIEVARRITRCLREMDTVARFGGDEFVVLLGELDSEKSESINQVAIVAEKIRAVLAEVYMLNSKGLARVEHHCSSSIGVALFLDHEQGAEDILSCADMAMYQAKELGRNQVYFADCPDRMHNP